MAERVQIPIVPGRQIWALTRTTRDGAQPGPTGKFDPTGPDCGRFDTCLPEMTAAAVRHFLLTEPGESKGAKHELVKTGPNEWRFGLVRPLEVLSIHQSDFPDPMPTGKVLANYRTSLPDTIPTVRVPAGDTPWQIVVEFWWRGPPKTIDYPGMAEELFGRSYRLNGADWILAWAVQPEGPQPADPGAQSWEQAQGANAADAIKKAGRDIADTVDQLKIPVAGVAVAGIALYLLLSRRGR